MKFSGLFLLAVFSIASASAEITCNSAPAASCVKSDKMCLEYFEEAGDPALWQSICQEMNGVYSAGGCDVSQAVLKCLTPTMYTLAPMMYFLSSFTYDKAKKSCDAIKGTICQ